MLPGLCRKAFKGVEAEGEGTVDPERECCVPSLINPVCMCA